MELCPRCTSTVADGAHSCPTCGASIWQPGSAAPQVAVTPAPVALVPPVPPATPPALPAAPTPPAPSDEQLSLPMGVTDQLAEPSSPPAPAPNGNGNGNGNGYLAPHWVPPLGTDPHLRSVAVNLPPQRVAPTDAAPALPPPHRSETVVPAHPPAQRKPNQLAVVIGTIAPLLAVVVLIIALPAQGAKQKPVAVVATDGDAQFDLRALAAAEETSLTATEAYSTDSAALEAAGYQPAPGKPVSISAGVSKNGYCLVASAGGATAAWYLYDSKQGGLLSTSFPAEGLAQQACADTAISAYVPIT